MRNREDAAALGSSWTHPGPPAQHAIHACSSEGVVAGCGRHPVVAGCEVPPPAISGAQDAEHLFVCLFASLCVFPNALDMLYLDTFCILVTSPCQTRYM